MWRNGKTKSGHEGEWAKVHGVSLFLKARRDGKAALFGVAATGLFSHLRTFPSVDAAKAAVKAVV